MIEKSKIDKLSEDLEFSTSFSLSFLCIIHIYNNHYLKKI